MDSRSHIGYLLEFTTPPPRDCPVKQTPLPLDQSKRSVLLQEVDKLLTKKAIYKIYPPFLPGFWSTFFLAPKKTGDWRPILNLKPLNAYIRPKRFRMENLSYVLRSHFQGYWATSIDLKDAYLHVPIHKAHHKWLRFMIQGQAYAFRCLPFGLSTAPRVFTRIVKSIGAALRRKGVIIFLYLDDWLILAPSRELVIQHTAMALEFLKVLGFIVNLGKSNLIPTQFPIFLGASFDLLRSLVRPTVDSFLQTQNETFAVTTSSSLQTEYPPAFKDGTGLSGGIKRADMVVPEIESDSGCVIPSAGSSVGSGDRCFTVRLGGHMCNQTARGVWSLEESREHINVLEMWAVERTLLHFVHFVTGKTVLVKTDNTTVVAYINKQGGTRSPSLCLHVRRILFWCMDHGIQLRARHIPGVDNVLADSLSRWGALTPTEWTLSSQVFQALRAQRGFISIDLFASHHNHRLPVYCSRVQDDSALACDALSIDWTGMAAYAYPPISLIPRVLQKIRRENCIVLLIAPWWPRQAWFHALIQLLVDCPIVLPLNNDLLRMPGSQVRFHDVQHLKLTAWTLSNDVVRRRGFLSRLPSWSLVEEENPLSRYTLLVSSVSSNGVIRNKSVPILQL